MENKEMKTVGDFVGIDSDGFGVNAQGGISRDHAGQYSSMVEVFKNTPQFATEADRIDLKPRIYTPIGANVVDRAPSSEESRYYSSVLTRESEGALASTGRMARNVAVNAAYSLGSFGHMLGEIGAKGVQALSDIESENENKNMNMLYRQLSSYASKVADLQRYAVKENQRKLFEDQLYEGSLSPLSSMIEKSVAPVLLSVGVAIASASTGGAAGAALSGTYITAMGASAGYDSYLQALERDMNPTAARIYGGMKGGLVLATEKIGLGFIAAGMSSKIALIVNGAIGEGVESLANELGDIVLDVGFGVKRYNYADEIKDDIVVAVSSAVLEGTVGGISSAGVASVWKLKYTKAVTNIVNKMPVETQQKIFETNSVKDVKGLSDKLFVKALDAAVKDLQTNLKFEPSDGVTAPSGEKYKLSPTKTEDIKIEVPEVLSGENTIPAFEAVMDKLQQDIDQAKDPTFKQKQTIRKGALHASKIKVEAAKTKFDDALVLINDVTDEKQQPALDKLWANAQAEYAQALVEWDTVRFAETDTIAYDSDTKQFKASTYVAGKYIPVEITDGKLVLTPTDMSELISRANRDIASKLNSKLISMESRINSIGNRLGKNELKLYRQLTRAVGKIITKEAQDMNLDMKQVNGMLRQLYSAKSRKDMVSKLGEYSKKLTDLRNKLWIRRAQMKLNDAVSALNHTRSKIAVANVPNSASANIIEFSDVLNNINRLQVKITPEQAKQIGNEILELGKKDALMGQVAADYLWAHNSSGIEDVATKHDLADVIGSYAFTAFHEQRGFLEEQKQKISQMRSEASSLILSRISKATKESEGGLFNSNVVLAHLSSVGSSIKMADTFFRDMFGDAFVDEYLPIFEADLACDGLTRKWVEAEKEIALKYLLEEELTHKEMDKNGNPLTATYRPRYKVKGIDSKTKEELVTEYTGEPQKLTVLQLVYAIQDLIKPDGTVDVDRGKDRLLRWGVTNEEFRQWTGVDVERGGFINQEDANGIGIPAEGESFPTLLRERHIKYAVEMRQIYGQMLDLVAPVYAIHEGKPMGRRSLYVPHVVNTGLTMSMKSVLDTKLSGIIYDTVSVIESDKAYQDPKDIITGNANPEDVFHMSQDKLHGNALAVSLLETVPHGKPLEIRDARYAMGTAARAIAHYITHADINRKLSALFDSSYVTYLGREPSLLSMDELGDTKSLQQAVRHWLNVFRNDTLTVIQQGDATSYVNDLLSLWATSKIMTPGVALKQLSAVFLTQANLAIDNPLALAEALPRVITSLVELAKGQEVSDAILRDFIKSDFTYRRDSGKLSAELARMAEEIEEVTTGKMSAKLNAKTFEIVTFMIRKMDKFSTLVSYDMLMNTSLKKNPDGDKVQMALDAQKFINSTHQSGHLTQVAPLAGSTGVVQRASMMFLQAGMQFANLGHTALRRAIESPVGSEDRKREALKLLAIMLSGFLVAPWAEQSLANLRLFNPLDPDDLERMDIAKAANGYGIPGMMLKLAYDVGVGLGSDKNEDKPTYFVFKDILGRNKTFPSTLVFESATFIEGAMRLIESVGDYMHGRSSGEFFVQQAMLATADIMTNLPITSSLYLASGGARFADASITKAATATLYGPWAGIALRTAKEISDPADQSFDTRFKRIALALFGKSAYAIDKEMEE